MKKLARILPVVIIAFGAGASGLWYYHSGKAVATAQQLVTSYNSADAALGKFTVTYERIERTGFPSTGARFVNPAVEFTAPADETGAPPIQQQMKYTGNLDIIIDYLTNRFLIDMDGSATMALQIGEENYQGTLDKAQIKTALKAKNRAAFEEWGTLNFKDRGAVGKAARNIAEFVVDMGPMTLKNNAGEMLATHEAMNIHFLNHTQAEKAKFDLIFRAVGSETSPAYDKLASSILMSYGIPEDSSMLNLARLGKQDVDIDLSVSIPDVPPGKPMPNAEIIARKFEIKTNLYTLKLPTVVHLTEASGSRNADIRLNWQVEITQAGGETVREFIPAMAEFTPMIGKFAGTENVTVDQAVLNEKIFTAIPTASNLGPITLVLDMDASVPAPPEAGKPAPSQSDSLTLRNLNFSHQRWGIDAKGMAARQSGASPVVDVTVNCKRCDTLTSDIFLTANQIQDILNYTNPSRPQWDTSAEMQTRVNALLADIGRKDATSGDIAFGISSPAAGDFRINDKPSAEVMAKVMAVMMPQQAVPAQMEPAAGAPQPAPQQ